MKIPVAIAIAVLFESLLIPQRCHASKDFFSGSNDDGVFIAVLLYPVLVLLMCAVNLGLRLLWLRIVCVLLTSPVAAAAVLMFWIPPLAIVVAAIAAIAGWMILRSGKQDYDETENLI